MKAVIKFLSAFAFFAMASAAKAGALGALMCPTCVLPLGDLASGTVTQIQIDRAVQYANDIFPANFQPSNNDVMDVCNGYNCIQVRYDNAIFKWVQFRTWTLVDNYYQSGKNYINVSAAGRNGGSNGGVQRMPSGSNPTVNTSGHWEGVQWQYNGVPYQVTWMYVLDFATWTIDDRPDPYIFDPM